MQRMKYKVANWSAYNKALVNRGDITLWFSEDAPSHWYNEEKSGWRGRSDHFSDAAIELCLSLKYLYQLPYRSTQGLLRSLLKLSGLSLQTPCYSQMQRRAKRLKIPLKHITKNKGALDIVVDSSGLKLYGEGEWKVRQHGASKRRTWKKIHLAVDPLDHEIMAHTLTSNGCSDDHAFTPLMDQLHEPVERCYGDGAYDRKRCYDWCFERGTTMIAPPKRDAKPSKDPPKRIRNQAIARIKRLGGDENARKQWKKEVDYHTRSIAETAMFRLKTLCGDTLSARLDTTQHTEIAIKINILNAFTQLGMPQPYPVELNT